MTKEAKHKLKRKIKLLAFDDEMCRAVNNLSAMGAKPSDGVAPNSWEGMMQMLTKIAKFGSAEEKAAATLAAAAWMWGCKEKHLYNKVCEIIDAVDEADTEADAEADSASGDEEPAVDPGQTVAQPAKK